MSRNFTPSHTQPFYLRYLLLTLATLFTILGGSVNLWAVEPNLSATAHLEVLVAPEVSITSPANNATFTTGDNIEIIASASDAAGELSSVEFFQNGVSLGFGTNGPNGWTFTWQNVPAGPYTLTAVATNAATEATISSGVNIVVNDPAPANIAPTVSITSPTSSDQFTAPANITITADAADQDGSVTKVEFYKGTEKIGEDLNKSTIGN